jgi:hypothetical protein
LISLSAVSTVGSGVAGAGSHERNGLTIGWNWGAGRLSVPGHTPARLDPRYNYQKPIREWGYAGALRIGYVFQERFALGVELTGWREHESLDGYGLVAPTLTYYAPFGGAYLRAGAGSGNGNGSPNGTGVGALGALGYELWVSRRFALDPQMAYVYSRIEQVSISYLNLTLGLTGYF